MTHTERHTDTPPERPAYQAGQVLHADDLRADGAERIVAAQRHQALLHQPGIVAGLLLEVRGNTVSVTPGMAIDGGGRRILVPQTVTCPLPPAATPEIWLAYREANQDERIVEKFTLYYEAVGEHDPEQPENHPQHAVFLGSTTNFSERHLGRVYVGAIGDRVDAASGRCQLLLGPTGPTDLRLFAISTRADATADFTDRCTIDATTMVTLHSPTTVQAADAPATMRSDAPATIRVAVHDLEWQSCEICQPALLRGKLDALAEKFPEVISAYERALLNAHLPVARWRTISTRCVNRLIHANAITDQLVQFVLAAGVIFSAATAEELRFRTPPPPSPPSPPPPPPTPQHNAARLRRFVLQDYFGDAVAPLPVFHPNASGVVFAEPRPLPTTALPQHAYLTIPDPKLPARELRLEIKNPGKEDHPERFKVAFGTVQPEEKESAKTTFTPIFVVAADQTVTVPKVGDKIGVLKVYSQYPANDVKNPDGLILKVKPPGAASTTATLAEQLGAVPPWALSLEELKLSIAADKLTVAGFLRNSGTAPIIGLQFHAAIYLQSDLAKPPQQARLLTNAVLPPGPRQPILTPDVLPVEVALDPEHKGKPLKVFLYAAGIGPGNILTQVEQPPMDVNP